MLYLGSSLTLLTRSYKGNVIRAQQMLNQPCHLHPFRFSTEHPFKSIDKLSQWSSAQRYWMHQSDLQEVSHYCRSPFYARLVCFKAQNCQHYWNIKLISVKIIMTSSIYSSNIVLPYLQHPNRLLLNHNTLTRVWKYIQSWFLPVYYQETDGTQ